MIRHTKVQFEECAFLSMISIGAGQCRSHLSRVIEGISSIGCGQINEYLKGKSGSFNFGVIPIRIKPSLIIDDASPALMASFTMVALLRISTLELGSGSGVIELHYI